jgi:thioredoxin reductase
LRWDWNSLLCDDSALRFTNYSGSYLPSADTMCAYLRDFAERLGLAVRYGARALRIRRAGGFLVDDASGARTRCRCLIVATGCSRPHVPAIAGIESAEGYGEVSVDPQQFVGQRVLVIGKGNSAFETANALVETAAAIHLASPHPVRMAWQTHFVGNLRAVNNDLLDTYQLKSQNAVLDADIERIERDGAGYRVRMAYTHAGDEVEELRYDRVIVCTGFRFDDTPFDGEARPQLVIDGRFPAQTAQWESVNVPDMFFCGTLMQARDYRKTTSGFIHGFRYNARALHRMLERRYHGVPWPALEVCAEPRSLAEHVLARFNRSSALWQQFGFLADVLVPASDGATLSHYEEMPVDHVHAGGVEAGSGCFLLTLEYGPDHARRDPFGAARIARDDVARAHESSFLHPVVRHHVGGVPVAEHHVIEDLAAEWREPEHLEPLVDFFAARLRAG